MIVWLSENGSSHSNRMISADSREPYCGCRLKAPIAVGVECDEECVERHHGEALHRRRIVAFDSRKQTGSARFDFERSGAIERQIGAHIASDGFFVQVAAKNEFGDVLTRFFGAAAQNAKTRDEICRLPAKFQELRDGAVESVRFSDEFIAKDEPLIGTDDDIAGMCSGNGLGLSARPKRNGFVRIGQRSLRLVVFGRDALRVESGIVHQRFSVRARACQDDIFHYFADPPKKRRAARARIPKMPGQSRSAFAVPGDPAANGAPRGCPGLTAGGVYRIGRKFEISQKTWKILRVSARHALLPGADARKRGSGRE